MLTLIFVIVLFLFLISFYCIPFYQVSNSSRISTPISESKNVEPRISRSPAMAPTKISLPRLTRSGSPWEVRTKKAPMIISRNAIPPPISMIMLLNFQRKVRGWVGMQPNAVCIFG